MNLQRSLLTLVVVFLFQLPAFATWSIIAVDSRSGEIVIASATCLRQQAFRSMGAKDLRDIQAVVVPGKGAAMLQASIDITRKNQRLVQQELENGTAPDQILTMLKANDTAVESRQFGILDLQGRGLGFTGTSTIAVALSQTGRAADSIYYQIQGNILAADAVIHDASRAFENARGMLADRVMAAMDAADARGGDRRCTGGKTADVAYVWLIDRSGQKTNYISVTDEDIQPSENRNPVKTLRIRYDKLFHP
jgi:uncharacterized Ntn-hydrolase superfamily protein